MSEEQNAQTTESPIEKIKEFVDIALTASLDTHPVPDDNFVYDAVAAFVPRMVQALRQQVEVMRRACNRVVEDERPRPQVVDDSAFEDDLQQLQGVQHGELLQRFATKIVGVVQDFSDEGLAHALHFMQIVCTGITIDGIGGWELRMEPLSRLRDVNPDAVAQELRNTRIYGPDGRRPLRVLLVDSAEQPGEAAEQDADQAAEQPVEADGQ